MTFVTNALWFAVGVGLLAVLVVGVGASARLIGEHTRVGRRLIQRFDDWRKAEPRYVYADGPLPFWAPPLLFGERKQDQLIRQSKEELATLRKSMAGLEDLLFVAESEAVTRHTTRAALDEEIQRIQEIRGISAEPADALAEEVLSVFALAIDARSGRRSQSAQG